MDTTVVSSLADGSRAPVRRRVALVFTDIVGSTRLLSALGDLEGNRRILDHHRLATRVLRSAGGGDIINTGGDSIFLAFPKPREALRFALRLQHALRRWLVDEPAHLRVRDRIGIHYGEVEEAYRPDGAKDLTGFAVSLAFSVMELAGPDQVLLSAAAFDTARAAPDEGELSEFPNLRWLSHGRYHIKGLDLPVPVFEVGEENAALLQPPGHSPEDRATDDDLIGWRPAIAHAVPGTPWVIERFLGSSGFGEVWLARDAQRRDVCALRFCFRQDRVRALRDATPLFERLKLDVADCPGITRLRGFQFDHAPHYLENEYVPGSTLTELCHGAVADAPPEAYRLEIIAQIAEALDAAHNAGIVHGDLKPAVVVVQPGHDPTHRPRVKIIDFGTGILLAKELAADLSQGIGPSEVTRPDPGPAAGAPLYWAPELFKGSPPSPASDIYALGVLLYQLLVCDLSQPVTVDVARQVRDPLLLDDLLACLATNPQARLRSAGQLASRLRRLPERRRELVRRERRAYWQGVLRTAAVAVVVIGLTGWLAWRAMEKEEEATIAAILASEAQRIAETNAVRLRVSNGVRLMAEGDLTGSLEQFVEALRQDTGGPARDDIHRRRIASVLRSAPRQVHEWHLGEPAIGIAIDPTGEWIAAGTSSGRIEVWNARDGKSEASLQASGGLYSLGFVPGAHQIYAHTASGDLLTWDWQDALRRTQPSLLASAVTEIACSRDGHWFAAADARAGVELIGGAKGDEGRVHLNGPEGVYNIAFSRDGSLLAGACYHGNSTRLCLWNVASRTLVTEREPPGGPIRFLEFDPAGTHLLVTTEREVHLLSIPDLASAAPSRRHEDVVMWAGFAPRGTLMMSTSAGPGSRVQVLDIAGASGLPVDLPHPHSVTGGDLSPDGRYVLTGCFDRHLRLWDPGRVQLVSEPVRHPAWRDHRNFRVRFLPDGRRAVTMVDDAVRVFDFASHASTLPPLELEAPIVLLAQTRDGRRLAGATRDGRAALWDSETGLRLTDRIRHPGGLRQIFFDDTGGKLLALEQASHSEEPAKLWVTDLSEARPEPRTLGTVLEPTFGFVTAANDVHVVTTNGHWWVWSLEGAPDTPPKHRQVDARIQGAEVSNDGATIATIEFPSEDRSVVHVWSVETAERRCPVLDPGFRARRLAFSGDGRRLVTACTDGQLEPRPAVRWDLETGDRLEPSLWHEDGVLSVAYHPTDARIVTGGEDSMVRLWDPRGATPLMAEQRMGYQVLHVGFNEDGRLFAAASVDGTVRVWESDTGEPVTPVLRHPTLVWRTWFNAGSTRLITLCYDGRVYLWDIAPTTDSPDQLTALAAILKGDRTPGADHTSYPGRDLPAGGAGGLSVAPAAIAAWHRREAGLCIKEGQDALALGHIEHALAALPGHWPLHWQRARLLERLGRPEDAAAAYADVRRLDPDCDAAQPRIGKNP